MLFTVSEIIRRAKAAADMHDDFVDTQTWLDWVSAENVALQLFIARGGYCANAIMSIYPADGTGLITLGTGILAVVGVFERESDGRLRPLRHSPFIDVLHQVNSGATTFTGPAIGPASQWSVRMVSDQVKLTLWPCPTSGDYLVVYLNRPTQLSTTDNITCPDGWEEYVVYNCAIRAVEKEEGDTRILEKRLDKVMARIEQNLGNMALSQAPAIRNVDKTERGWQPGVNWPPPVGEWFFL